MVRSVFILLALLALSAKARVSVGTIAASTTIVVNVLEIKQTVHKARVAAHTVGHTSVKAVKTVGRKVVGR